jgi:hypothetical protein
MLVLDDASALPSTVPGLKLFDRQNMASDSSQEQADQDMGQARQPACQVPFSIAWMTPMRTFSIDLSGLTCSPVTNEQYIKRSCQMERSQAQHG